MFEPKKFTDLFEAMRGHSAGVLTDFEVGSVTRTLTEAFAFEMALLYEKMQMVYLSGFVDTAVGSQLDNVVAILGVQRGLPDFSEGKVLFIRDPGQKDILVPTGTLVSTEEAPEAPKKVFRTLEDLVIPKDQIQGEARIQAIARGEEQDTPADTIVVLPRPIPGIKAVNNPSEVKLSGKSRETDDQLRRRAKNTLLAAGKATRFAIENALIQLPKVRDVRVVEPFNATNDPDVTNRYGLIDVYIDHPEYEQNNDPIYQIFATTVDEVRAAGIFPRIYPSPVTQVQVTFKIKPAQSNLTEKEAGILENKIAEAVRNYIQNIPINEKLSISKMVKQLLLAEGVDSLDNYRMALTRPDKTTTIKTFADTQDIDPPVNGRFRINTLKVFATDKQIAAEAHFLLPAGVSQTALVYNAASNDPKAAQLPMVDKATLVNNIAPSATAANKKTIQDSMTLLYYAPQKPDEAILTNSLTVEYGETAQVNLLSYRKELRITGAFILTVPPGTPLTDVDNAKQRARQNLERFFTTRPPATQSGEITFDEMIAAAENSIGFKVGLSQPTDFTASVDNAPAPNRITGKGIKIEAEEKATIAANF